MPTKFIRIADLCERLSKITEKNAKITLVSNFIKELEPDEIDVSVRLIIGKVFPDWSDYTLDLSWITVIKIIKKITKAKNQEILEAFSKTGDPGEMARILIEKKGIVKQATLLSDYSNELSVIDVYRALERIAKIKGEGSRERKIKILENLLRLAKPIEAKYIIKVILGEMRHGFNEGLMEEAIAKASRIPVNVIRRANMLLGDIGEVARIALINGYEYIKNVKMKLFHPIKPMLAQQAESVTEALKEHGGKSAFEFKLDGARVQVHKQGDKVMIFSRRLTNVTESLPDIVELIKRELKAEEAIVEGEVIAVGENNKPLPFQFLMRRFKRVKDINRIIREIPVELYLFDCLYLNGNLLIDLPYIDRWKNLTEIHGKIKLVPRLITSNPDEAQEFFKLARKQGHEGLMAKKLDSEYTPGTRGKKWLKIKETLSALDLVIIAADWGYGRRKDWLSDYYLAARDKETGEFYIVGKTFKGLTDEEFKEMTKRLLELKIGERGRTIFVKPEIVVEVVFDEIQKSPKYKSGFALRFARITKIRYDKSPDEADTIDRIKELYIKQFETKARK